MKLDIHENVTMAPLLLTERDLITIMDKQGIGTDATIAEHIKNI
jgi:DNA topoisomerase-3